MENKKSMIETVESAIDSATPTSRREFLKYSSFALSAVTMPFWLTACGSGSVTTSIPPVTPPSSSLRVAGETNYVMVVADKTSALASVMVLDNYTVVVQYASDPVGAIYSWRIICPDGSVGTIRMNTLQKPYDFTMDGYVVAFRNYTATTVEVTVNAPDGTTETKIISLDVTSVPKELFLTAPLEDPTLATLMTASSGPYKTVALGIFDPDTWFKNEIEKEARDMCVKGFDAVIQTFTLGFISITKISKIADKIVAIKSKVTTGLNSLVGKIDAGATSVVHGSEGPFNTSGPTDDLTQMADDRRWGQAYRERLDGSTSGNVFADTTTRDSYMANTYSDYSDWSNYSDWGNAYSNWSNVYSNWSNSYSNWSNSSTACTSTAGAIVRPV